MNQNALHVSLTVKYYRSQLNTIVISLKEIARRIKKWSLTPYIQHQAFIFAVKYAQLHIAVIALHILRSHAQTTKCPTKGPKKDRLICWIWTISRQGLKQKINALPIFAQF